MRAVVQGVDLRASWERYLCLEGDHTDVRKVRSTIAWIRQEFAAAARRQAKFGTARLVLIEHRDQTPEGTPPTLDDFARARGMEDFSEAEQLEAYEEAYGKDSRNQSRRARLVQRQLQALTWLERLVAQRPGPGDAVSAWLPLALAGRIEAAGMPTLFTLAERINGRGLRWWTGLRAIGETKGRRILEWMRLYEDSIGVRIQAHTLVPRAQLQSEQLARVVPAQTALVPLEKLLVPTELDGSRGRYRAPMEHCLFAARNDYDAIGVWLASRGGKIQRDGLSLTQLAYRREAERLLLWSILERRKPISSLTVEDAIAYMDFLAAPPAAWCGKRHQQRWSPLWRPLEGPLSPKGRRQAGTILRTLYTFLIAQGYLIGNPFLAVTLPANKSRALGSGRTLTFDQWDLIQSQLDQDGASDAVRRRDRACKWLYATGARIAEITAFRCGDLAAIDLDEPGLPPTRGYLITVVGKGERVRELPVPPDLVDELSQELGRNGREPDALHPSNAQLPVLAIFGQVRPGEPRPWSASGVYQALKALFEQCARRLEEPDASHLRRASTHWLRHTHGSHALEGRDGADPVPLQMVQANLGHASLNTTTGYIRTEQRSRIRAMQGFWKGGPRAPDAADQREPGTAPDSTMRFKRA